MPAMLAANDPHRLTPISMPPEIFIFEDTRSVAFASITYRASSFRSLFHLPLKQLKCRPVISRCSRGELH